MEYYDLKKHWTKKVVPHLNKLQVLQALVKHFRQVSLALHNNKEFVAGMLPCQFDSCDWRFEHRGKPPRFWDYTCHGKCHWLVNFNLELAKLVLPERPWRIITSDNHSTVWDGESMLFEFNFLALGIPPNECYFLAHKRVLRIGKDLRTYYPMND